MERVLSMDSIVPKIGLIKSHPDAKLPAANNKHPMTGDTGYDLYCVEGAYIQPKQSKVVDVGLTVAYVEPGYWFQINPRSGLGFKYGIQPHLGVIDNCVPAGTQIRTTEGDVEVQDLYNMKNIPDVISLNTEQFQPVVDKITDMWMVPDVELVEISTDDNTVRVPKTKEVYTKRGWVQAKDLTEDDFIVEIY